MTRGCFDVVEVGYASVFFVNVANTCQSASGPYLIRSK